MTAQTRYTLPGFNRASDLLKLKPQLPAQDQVLSSGTGTDHGTYPSRYSSTFYAAASHCKSKTCLQTLKKKKKKTRLNSPRQLLNLSPSTLVLTSVCAPLPSPSGQLHLPLLRLPGIQPADVRSKWRSGCSLPRQSCEWAGLCNSFALVSKSSGGRENPSFTA